MKRFRLPVMAAALSLFSTQVTHAAAFQFYELGAPNIGTASVGQTVITNNASTSYFNPAAMSSLSNTQLMLGAQMMLENVNFTPSPDNTISGGNGSNAGGLLPGADGYFVYVVNPKVRLGVSVNMPYGGALNYDNHWVGRYVVQQMMLYTINVNPSIAYQLNPWMSLGGGLSVEYANLYQTVALPISSTTDGQATLKLDNVSPGVNLGAFFTPSPATKVGLAYRSQIIHNLRGTASFMNITTTTGASTKLVMPSNVIASLSQQVTSRLTLLGEAGWSNWSSMDNTVIFIYGYSAVTPQNWHDTYRLGLAGQYQVTSDLIFQAGASFDSSPTSASHRLPDLPMDAQIRLGMGVEYQLTKTSNLGVSYEFLDLGNASINNKSSDGYLAGSYSRNNVNILQVSLNVDC